MFKPVEIDTITIFILQLVVKISLSDMENGDSENVFLKDKGKKWNISRSTNLSQD